MPPSPLTLIRLLEPSDSIHDLTLFINRSFKPLADMGLKYVGTWQDDDITRKRLRGAECWVGLIDTRIVATVLLRDALHTNAAAWYAREDVAAMGQFAVEREFQGSGIGSAMLAHTENRARETGASELALDTAEPAVHLIKWYEKHGYRIVEHVNWGSIVNYGSVIMSKRL